jgi:hypothetical protein
MKPKPRWALKNLTVPLAMMASLRTSDCAPREIVVARHSRRLHGYLGGTGPEGPSGKSRSEN